MWEKTLYLDNTKSKQVLKIDYKEANQAILAMAESLYSSGQVVRNEENISSIELTIIIKLL